MLDVSDKTAFARAYAECGYSIRKMSVTTGINRRTLGRWRDRHELAVEEGSSSVVTHEGATLVGPKSVALMTPEDLMALHKFDPEEWIQEKAVPNVWEANAGNGEKIQLHQLKLFLRRKVHISVTFAAIADGYQYDPPRTIDPTKPIKVLFIGDQQAPWHDQIMHALLLQWIEAEDPDVIVLLGDGLNFADISRHPKNPEWDDKVMECIQSCYEIYRDYREAAPQARIIKLPGNHDWRIRDAILKHLSQLHGLTRASTEDDPFPPGAFSLPWLLRFDELQIEFADPDGEYEFASVPIHDKLIAEHGHLAGKHPGDKMLERINHHIVFGHTHDQGIATRVVYDSHGNPHTYYAVSPGCTCLIKGGLGYAKRGEWTNGAAKAFVWPDGRPSFQLAHYEDGSFICDDLRFTAPKSTRRVQRRTSIVGR